MGMPAKPGTSLFNPFASKEEVAATKAAYGPKPEKVHVVGQGFDPTDPRWGAVKDAFGVTIIPGDKAKYDAWQVSERARQAEEKSKADAEKAPDLTSDAVKAAVSQGYRDASIARRSRANSFQSGVSGFANQGQEKAQLLPPPPPPPEILPPPTAPELPTVKAKPKSVSDTPRSRAIERKKAGRYG